MVVVVGGAECVSHRVLASRELTLLSALPTCRLSVCIIIATGLPSVFPDWHFYSGILFAVLAAPETHSQTGTYAARRPRPYHLKSSLPKTKAAIVLHTEKLSRAWREEEEEGEWACTARQRLPRIRSSHIVV